MSKFKNAIRIAALFVATIGSSLLLFGCQYAAKNLGGTTTLNLPESVKLMEITWKDDDLWYLARPMREDEFPETYEFKESSDYGFEGKVVIKESKGE